MYNNIKLYVKICVYQNDIGGSGMWFHHFKLSIIFECENMRAGIFVWLCQDRNDVSHFYLGFVYWSLMIVFVDHF